MRRLLVAVIGAAGISLLAAACGSGSTGSAGPAGTTPAPAASSSASQGNDSATISLRAISGIPGKVLVDGRGRTLYLFEADKGEKSMCSGACAAAWPPFTVTGAPHAGPGVNQAMLGMIHRSDGTAEVVYNGHPLYYFSGDTEPGDDSGQGSKAFGAGWYVVSPSGKKIDTD